MKNSVQRTIEDAHKAYNHYQEKICLADRKNFLISLEAKKKDLERRQKRKVADILSLNKNGELSSSVIKKMIGVQNDWDSKETTLKKIAHISVVLKLPEHVLDEDEKEIGQVECNFLTTQKKLLVFAGFTDEAEGLAEFIRQAEEVLKKKRSWGLESIKIGT